MKEKDRFAVMTQEPWTCQVFRSSDAKEEIGECNKGRGDILTEHDENLAVSTWLSIELLTASLTNMSHQIREPCALAYYLLLRYL